MKFEIISTFFRIENPNLADDFSIPDEDIAYQVFLNSLSIHERKILESIRIPFKNEFFNGIKDLSKFYFGFSNVYSLNLWFIKTHRQFLAKLGYVMAMYRLPTQYIICYQKCALVEKTKLKSITPSSVSQL